MPLPPTSRRALLAGALALLAAPAARGQAPPPEGQPAVLVVRLPADARLEVDGEATRQTGPVRRFVSPPLEPGVRFLYTLTATWEPNNYTHITRTRRARVQAGQETEVDLRAADPARPDKFVIRYVPTPPEVVDAMLKLAGVGKDDVVFDLGCGDGRIVVAAVSRFGAKRGVGVDLDPQRVRESEANARREGVHDRVEFRRGDVMEVKDLDSATVVALYLSDALNVQLRPLLQKALKPGSRIVSHRFTMGDWKPEKTERIKDRQGEEYRIHLWRVGPK